jgi:hypothetical protein
MSTRTIERVSFTLLLSGVLLSSPGYLLHAQTVGSLAGTVLSAENDAPLKGVTVAVLEGDFQTVTDEDGGFFFPELPTGEITLRAELSGYASVVERVGLTPAEVGILQLRLAPIMAALSELLVVVGRGATSSGPADVLVLGGTDDSRTALDMLAEKIPGVNVSQGSVSSGAQIRIRGSSSLFLSNAPSVYLDGIRITPREGSFDSRWSSGLHALELVPASLVKRIRVLRGPSASSLYGDATHGVILIETHDGGP